MQAKRGVVVTALVAVFLVALSEGTVAENKIVAIAPIPSQILSAKKIFVANAGGEQPWYEDAQFDGAEDRAYNQFYSGMKAWGRYELAATPADADLLFEIQFACPPALGAANQGGDSIGGRPFDPHFRLVIREAKTNSLLWVISERVQWAVTRGNRNKNFDQALNRVISDVQNLVGTSTTGGTPSNS